MASRERKRAKRRKRKERSQQRRSDVAAQREQRAARREARDRAAREALEPLATGERPGIVTAGAAISALLAIGTVIAYAVGLEVSSVDDFGTETGQTRPSVFATAISAAVLGAMSYGMWRARYWAVLGFQTILVLVIVLASLALVQATDVLRALGLVAVIAVCGFLFFRMVKAMARIQMPERRTYGQ